MMATNKGLGHSDDQPPIEHHGQGSSPVVYSYDQPLDVQYEHEPESYSHNYCQTNSTFENVDQPDQNFEFTQSVPNYPALAILSAVAVCCFWPTGIVAVVYALNSSNAADIGKMVTAKRYSVNARYFSILSIVIGVVIIMACVILKLIIFD